MEYILQNTDIFDEEIALKFSNAIKGTLDNYIDETAYKIEVTFHANLLKDIRVEIFDAPNPYPHHKRTKKDKIYDVMSLQLKKLEKVLNENGIQLYNLHIQGDVIEAENIIKIDISEDISETNFMGRGKNERRMKVYSIMPSLPGFRKRVLDMPYDFLRKTFNEYIYTIGDEKQLAEILGIKKTSNHSELFDAFVEQYGSMWLDRSKLLDQLKEKSLSIIEKRFEKQQLRSRKN